MTTKPKKVKPAVSLPVAPPAPDLFLVLMAGHGGRRYEVRGVFTTEALAREAAESCYREQATPAHTVVVLRVPPDVRIAYAGEVARVGQA